MTLSRVREALMIQSRFYSFMVLGSVVSVSFTVRSSQSGIVNRKTQNTSILAVIMEDRDMVVFHPISYYTSEKST